MNKITLTIFFILACIGSVYAEERIKLTYVEFTIPTEKSNQKYNDSLAKFEQVPSFTFERFQSLLEEGIKKKTILVMMRESRLLETGKSEVLAKQADVTMTDKSGKTVEVRPSLLFTISPWILGDSDKPFVGFDLVFQRNEIDRKVAVQNHFAWWRLDLSNYQNSLTFGEVKQFGGRDKVKNQYHALAIYFERIQ